MSTSLRYIILYLYLLWLLTERLQNALFISHVTVMVVYLYIFREGKPSGD